MRERREKIVLNKRIDEGLSLEAVWSYLNYFEIIENNIKIIEKNINENYSGLDYQKIITEKAKTPNKYDLQSIINQGHNLNPFATEIQLTIKQAKEYFFGSRYVSNLTKPVLLYYGMVQLGKTLILTTYSFKNPKPGHGLKMTDSNQAVGIFRRGFFSRFHDCLSSDIFYCNEPKFELKQLLESLPELKYYRELLDSNQPFTIKSPLTNGTFRRDVLSQPEVINNIRLTKLDVYFIIMFFLSSLVRYNPTQWNKICIGEDPQIFIINEFLRLSEKVFPNLILNELTGLNHIFIPESVSS